MRSAISPWTIMLFAAIVLLLASCVPTPQAESSPPPPIPTQPSAQAPTPSVQHWVQDAKLRQVMAEIGRRVPSLPRPLAQDAATQPVTSDEFDKIAVLASRLSQSSEQIVPVVKDVVMTEHDRLGFAAAANDLHDQSDRLQKAAAERRIQGVQQSMDAINSTCISCHSRYRDFAGQIDLSQGRS